MLALIETQIPSEVQVRISLLLADITRIPLAGQFSLIVMPCNTLSTLTRQAQADVLRGVRSLLAPRGMFAVSLPNPELLRAFASPGGARDRRCISPSPDW